ncbi:MAG: hypothetical protein ABFC65_09055 [Rectinema sp.]
MKTKFVQLSTEEKSVLARLKASLALHMVEEASAADAGLQKICPSGGVSMKFSIRGAGPALGLQMPKISQILPAPPGRPSLLLFFPNTEAAVRVLSGAKGAVIPVPLGANAFRVLDFFRKASSRATELLRAPDTSEATRARLLLAATLYGLEAIAGESYLERRMQIVPDGVVGVRAGELAFRVAKRGRTIHVQRDAQPEDTSPGDVLPEDAPPAAATGSLRPDALLSFAGYRSAIDVLSGKRQAVIALGSGEVHIEGLLPLVQGLFAVLDRLSWYLGVEV